MCILYFEIFTCSRQTDQEELHKRHFKINEFILITPKILTDDFAIIRNANTVFVNQQTIMFSL